MPDKVSTRERYGEAFWRKHHEAWQQSALNQREYCEAHGIPLGLELLVAADVIGTGRGPHLSRALRRSVPSFSSEPF